MSLTPLLVGLALQTVAAQPPFRCEGPYVPPTDYDARGEPVFMEFAVATALATSSRTDVEEAARAQLVQRLCRLADQSSCAPLAASARPWDFGKQGDRICAMAVLSVPDLENWRNQLAPDLDADLKATFAALLPPPEQTTPRPSSGKGVQLPFAKKKKPRTAVVVIGDVVDNGAPGGIRAEWLLGRVRSVLTSLDVEMREAPRGWDGARPPRDVELLLRGHLVERVDTKRQLPVLEATFVAVNARGVTRAARPIMLPAALAPAPPRPLSAMAPPPLVGLSLHAEARAGGSLCPGDYTQLHLTNETEDPLYVRVFNLDANGEVLLLFPSETRADDRVAPGTTVTLSEDGFTVEGEAGARERYIALAARTPEGLGAFSEMRGTCRFRPKDAQKLSSGKKLEAAYRATSGFTLLDDVRCRKAIPLPDKALTAGALAQIPLCPAVD